MQSVNTVALNSGVISISAIRACGAAAVNDGHKKRKFSTTKNIFIFFCLKFFFLQIFCLNASTNCKFAAIYSKCCKKRVFGRKSHFLARHFSGRFYQKSDLSGGCRRPPSAAVGRRRPPSTAVDRRRSPSTGAGQPKNRCYSTCAQCKYRTKYGTGLVKTCGCNFVLLL